MWLVENFSEIVWKTYVEFCHLLFSLIKLCVYCKCKMQNTLIAPPIEVSKATGVTKQKTQNAEVKEILHIKLNNNF